MHHARPKPPAPVESAYSLAKRTRPMKWWHEAIIDDMLAFPLATHKERSARLGYTPEYIMMLVNSDMFQAAYQARKSNMREKLDDAVANKMSEVAVLSLDIMKETLEKKRSQIPFRDLAVANDSLLQRLGYGAPQSAQAATNVQVNVAPAITPEQLAQARDKLRATEQLRAIESPRPSAADHAIDITPTSEREVDGAA